MKRGEPQGHSAGVLSPLRFTALDDLWPEDAAARRKVAEALGESERMFSAAFRQSPLAMSLTSLADGRYLDVNEAFLRDSGHAREDVVGRTSAELGLFADPEARERLVAEVKAHGQVYGRECRFSTRSGEVLDCLISLSLVAVESRPFILSTIVNVTERKRMEAALKESEALFRGVLETLQDAYFRTDRDGRFVLLSPSVPRLYGYSSVEEMLGMPAASLYPNPGSRERMFAELRLKGQVQDYIGTGRRKDGSTFAVSLNAQPVVDAEGRIVGTEGVVRDITERRRAELEIEQLNATLEKRVADRTRELEAAYRELESFSYAVAHDLRSPLRGIDGWSQALLDEYGDRLDGTGRSYLDAVRQQAQRMAELIDTLLRLSRISRHPVAKEAVDLGTMARDLEAELRAAEPDRDVELVVETGLPPVEADPYLVRVVLQNLLGNAWKFTRGRERARVELASTSLGPPPAYVVRDNGAGFNMAFASRLFQPFQRLHGPDEFPGLGVGLVTVQRIVERHGGSIRGEASEGEGAAFHFTLSAA